MKTIAVFLLVALKLCNCDVSEKRKEKLFIVIVKTQKAFIKIYETKEMFFRDKITK